MNDFWPKTFTKVSRYSPGALDDLGSKMQKWDTLLTHGGRQMTFQNIFFVHSVHCAPIVNILYCFTSLVFPSGQKCYCWLAHHNSHWRAGRGRKASPAPRKLMLWPLPNYFLQYYFLLLLPTVHFVQKSFLPKNLYTLVHFLCAG